MADELPFIAKGKVLDEAQRQHLTTLLIAAWDNGMSTAEMARRTNRSHQHICHMLTEAGVNLRRPAQADDSARNGNPLPVVPPGRRLGGRERDAFIDAIAVRYILGATVKRIADETHVPYDSVKNLLKEGDVPMRPAGTAPVPLDDAALARWFLRRVKIRLLADFNAGLRATVLALTDETPSRVDTARWDELVAELWTAHIALTDATQTLSTVVRCLLHELANPSEAS
ncbi:hypothetical protein F0L68_34680 [Solihabitans fulvus]|uniref:Helix-turn-helix domain-containing protein n=1 Tax=Solihabitans fulvus TaxID=1892852 RepID=A0A5B2WNT8_9PSEU|nr:hypothetical protein [Solihabitans fulvus]KAA2252668.1 hypothetical protein F0L68_34680 [Solihabitans fulvus]